MVLVLVFRKFRFVFVVYYLFIKCFFYRSFIIVLRGKFYIIWILLRVLERCIDLFKVIE